MAIRCDCSIIIPTHNRPRILNETLDKLAELPDRRFEVIVVDNASTDDMTTVRERHPEVRWIDLPQNIAAAARNIGAVAANGRLLLMLDDDSWPEDGTIERAVELFDNRLELGAAACRVRLADEPNKHDAGGVPGIFFNCGGFIRKSAFLESGGFSFHFDYYVEEYDLSCRLLQHGWKIEPQGDLHVSHRRVKTGRDNNRMLRLLARNNLRLWRRYAPDARLPEMLSATLDRYERVALKEDALEGFEAGVNEAESDEGHLRARRSPLTSDQFSDLFGLHKADSALRTWADKSRIRRVAIWSRGKGVELVTRLAEEACLSIAAVYDDHAESEQWLGHRLKSSEQFDPHGVDGLIVGSLSPGVAEDIFNDLSRRFPHVRIVSLAPWSSLTATAEVAA
jgi:GT2 family glycosyltransferase